MPEIADHESGCHCDPKGRRPTWVIDSPSRRNTPRHERNWSCFRSNRTNRGILGNHRLACRAIIIKSPFAGAGFVRRIGVTSSAAADREHRQLPPDEVDMV
jgi:hypothetical protein